MKNASAQKKSLPQRFREFVAFCHSAASALDISDGEFYIWYGSPFILFRDSKKK